MMANKQITNIVGHLHRPEILMNFHLLALAKSMLASSDGFPCILPRTNEWISHGLLEKIVICLDDILIYMPI